MRPPCSAPRTLETSGSNIHLNHEVTFGRGHVACPELFKEVTALFDHLVVQFGQSGVGELRHGAIDIPTGTPPLIGAGLTCVGSARRQISFGRSALYRGCPKWDTAGRALAYNASVASVGQPPTPDPVWVDDLQIRMLGPSESTRLPEAVRAVYGETYPVQWTYDADDVARRISAGLLMSAIAETADGELLCHSGLLLNAPDDVVGHAGQALTLPAARGRHIFTRVKRYLVEWATTLGFVGMYSEATAAHPYSQRALLDLGGHETGFMLGFIPAAVENNAASEVRQGRTSAALFFLRMRPGTERMLYAPTHHRQIVLETIDICGSRAHLAEAPVRVDLPAFSRLSIERDIGDNVAVLTVHQAGRDLTARVDAERSRVFDEGVEALYLDLPLDRPESAHVSDSLTELSLSYSGIFPNNQAAGDVLRLQCLRNATAWSHDVAVASAHGAALLNYVIADMEAAGQRVERTETRIGEGPSDESVPLVAVR